MTETITTLRVEDVHPSPKHYREVKAAAVKTLADSIAVAGQLEPIRVWRDGDIYWIDAGHHRHAAMQLLGQETIEAIVIDDEDDAKSATVMVASNLHFAETEIERSRGTQLLLSTGVRPLEAAALTGEKPDRISLAARGLAVVHDETAAADLTIDRLIALAEFDDDPEIVDKLLTAPENRWQAIATDLRRSRKCDAAYAGKLAIVEASGVEILADNAIAGHRYLAHSDEMPEGAKFARVYRLAWAGSAEITWYGVFEEQVETPEQAAAREERDNAIAATEKAHADRLSFIAAHYDLGALRKLATVAWEGEGVFSEEPVTADVRSLEGPLEQLSGFIARSICAVLAEIESLASNTLGRDGVTGYNARHYGGLVVAYADALLADGYEPSETEAVRIEQVRAVVAGEGDE